MLWKRRDLHAGSFWVGVMEGVCFSYCLLVCVCHRKASLIPIDLMKRVAVRIVGIHISILMPLFWPTGVIVHARYVLQNSFWGLWGLTPACELHFSGWLQHMKTKLRWRTNHFTLLDATQIE